MVKIRATRSHVTGFARRAATGATGGGVYTTARSGVCNLVSRNADQ